MLPQKELEQLKPNTKSMSAGDLLHTILGKLCEEHITKQDKQLLALAFSKNPTQDELNKFLACWDIEAAGGHKAIMMAYFMKMHPHLHFTNYEFPRLQGLLKFHRFANLKLMAHYTKLGKALNQAQIPVMVIKGGAMKFLRPDLPRVMGDIDTLVHMDDFSKAIAVAETLGYDCTTGLEEHSVDLREPGSKANTIDVHKFLCAGATNTTLNCDVFWSRAKQAKVFGVDSYIPCPEDMLFISLMNLAKNLVAKTSVNGILYNTFDCKYVLEQNPDFDWGIVLQNARENHVEVQLFLAMHFINKTIPNLLPSNIISGEPFKKELKDYCENILFYSFFFTDLQNYSRTLSIRNIFDSTHNFKEYLRIKPKYIMIKKLRKKPFFSRLFIKYKEKLGAV